MTKLGLVRFLERGSINEQGRDAASDDLEVNMREQPPGKLASMNETPEEVDRADNGSLGAAYGQEGAGQLLKPAMTFVGHTPHPRYKMVDYLKKRVYHQLREHCLVGTREAHGNKARGEITNSLVTRRDRRSTKIREMNHLARTFGKPPPPPTFDRNSEVPSAGAPWRQPLPKVLLPASAVLLNVEGIPLPVAGQLVPSSVHGVLPSSLSAAVPVRGRLLAVVAFATAIGAPAGVRRDAGGLGLSAGQTVVRPLITRARAVALVLALGASTSLEG